MGEKLRQFEFRDGALLLSGPGLGELRLKWHPVPTAERRLGSGKWLPYQPEFRVLAPMTPKPEQSDADDGRLQAKHEAFHLPAINAGIIYLTSNAELAAMTSPKLLQEVAAAPEEYTFRLCAREVREGLDRDDPLPINRDDK